jgi:hypothetical protein
MPSPCRPPLANRPGSTHTFPMSLKNAALLAFIGMLFLAVLTAVHFVKIVSGILNNIVPALDFVPALIYLFASLTLSVFLFVFFRRES